MPGQAVATIGCLSILTVLAGCANSPAVRAPVVPDSLAVPANQVLSSVFSANGAQIYRCKLSRDNPESMEWVFEAPEAVLRDSAGHTAGRHYGGPAWESNDGSKVVAEVQSRYNAPD